MYADKPELKRLYWHSRRGMLELDLLLNPFASSELDKLSPELLDDYRRLMAEEDQDLYMWLTGRQKLNDSSFQNILRKILDFAKLSAHSS